MNTSKRNIISRKCLGNKDCEIETTHNLINRWLTGASNAAGIIKRSGYCDLLFVNF